MASRRRSLKGPGAEGEGEEEEEDAFESASENGSQSDLESAREDISPEKFIVPAPPEDGPASFVIHSPEVSPQESPRQDPEEAVEQPPEAKASVVPKGSKYFLHDDRQEATFEAAEGDQNEEAAEEKPKPKAKGKAGGGKSCDDPGPWQHDKFFELMEDGPTEKPAPERQQWSSRRPERRGGKDSSWQRDKPRDDRWSGGGGGGNWKGKDKEDDWNSWNTRGSGSNASEASWKDHSGNGGWEGRDSGGRDGGRWGDRSDSGGKKDGSWGGQRDGWGGGWSDRQWSSSQRESWGAGSRSNGGYAGSERRRY